MIEALTYRHMGHSRSDPATYRPEGELELWKERDPIVVFAAVLEEHGEIAAEDIAAARRDAEAAVEAAVQRAVSWPEPHPSERFAGVWAEA